MPAILYKKQKQILDFICQYIKKNESAPTLAEIAEAVGVSSLSTVYEHLAALESKGRIRRYHGAVRGIEIIDAPEIGNPGEVELPVVGYIVAGMPIEPYTESEVTIKVPVTMMLRSRRAFVLKVKGDSMIDEGILDNDYVVIEEQLDPRNIKDGDVVVAILGNGFATLKRFFRDKNRVRLEPANSSMKAIFVDNLEIRGKVIGVIRKY